MLMLKKIIKKWQVAQKRMLEPHRWLISDAEAAVSVPPQEDWALLNKSDPLSAAAIKPFSLCVICVSQSERLPAPPEKLSECLCTPAAINITLCSCFQPWNSFTLIPASPSSLRWWEVGKVRPMATPQLSGSSFSWLNMERCMFVWEERPRVVK